MAYELLPPVEEGAAPPLPHFPSRFHAAVFRLWETVSAERIAAALSIPEATVRDAAEAMGLPPQKYTDLWSERGYITTIRNAWHLLPYEQLLPLLGVTESEFAAILKDDDFLRVKLGKKPVCPPVRPEAPDEAQTAMLARIRETVQSEFEDLFSGRPPFDFFAPTVPYEAKTASDGADGDLRMIYSYCGLYARALDEDVSLSYPDALLAAYRDAGVNAVWLPVILYQMVPFPFDPSYSEGWESRQARLCELITRAAAYGIKVYLYLNEPRCMPIRFFDSHPDLLGRKQTEDGALCTSDPRILCYLRDAVTALCKAAPGLGGFFTITCSENMTHCKSVRRGEPCPRCKDVPIPHLVSDVVRTISEASRAIDPAIRTVSWTWAWEDYMTEDEIRECIDRIPKEVVIACNSEAKKEFTIGGVSGKVRDYSMSIPGPAPLSESIWRYAAARGHEVAAKVQINVTWECSTLPFLPVFDLIREHMTALRETGVRHLMMSWTLGGYPSVNLQVASDCLKDPSEAHYDTLLAETYGEHAPAVKRAAKYFSDAFRAFPFDLTTLYHGPQNAGPSNLLYEHPTGLASTMTCYAFDDLDRWRSIYPRETFLEQFRILSDKWRDGLSEIEELPVSPFTCAAWGGYALFRSSYLQILYIMNRENGDKRLLAQILREERDLARLMYNLMQRDPAFGYEAANHYYFNKGMLAEKVLSCDDLLKRLAERI